MRSGVNALCLVALTAIASLATPVDSSTPNTYLFNENHFTMFGQAGFPKDFRASVITHGGFGYILFSSAGDYNVDNPNGEFTKHADRSAHCYLRKVDSQMNTLKTWSLRSAGDSATVFNTQHCVCIPQQVDVSTADPAVLVLGLKLAGCLGSRYNFGEGFKTFNTATETFSDQVQARVGGNTPGCASYGCWARTHWEYYNRWGYSSVGTGYVAPSGSSFYGHYFSHQAFAGFLYKFSGVDGSSVWTSAWSTAEIDGGNAMVTAMVLDPTETYLIVGTSNGWHYIIDNAAGTTVTTHRSYFQARHAGGDGTDGAPSRMVKDLDGAGAHGYFTASSQASSQFLGVPCPGAQSVDIFVVRASFNATTSVGPSLHGKWCQRVGSSGKDRMGFMNDCLVAHPLHGVFVVGYTDGTVPGYTRTPPHSGLDFLIGWLDIDTGAVKEYFQGGNANTEMMTSIFFDPAAGLPPLVAGVANSDLDGGSGPMVYSGTGKDFIVGFFNFTEACPAGEFRSGIPPCSACPVGWYQPNIDQLSCIKCPAGSQTLAAHSATTCTQCPLGTVALEAGTQHCQPCQPGFYADQVGQATVCLPCLPGTYASSNGTANCDRCPVGTYSNVAAATSCIECPLSSSTEGDATAEERYCGCEPGFYGNPVGVFTGVIRECTACVAITSDCQSRNQQYPLPRPGYYIASATPGTALVCAPKAACPGGAVDTCGTGYTGEGCFECASGYYRDTGNCVECPVFDWAVVITIVIMLLGILTATIVVAILACVVLCCKGQRKRVIQSFKRLRDVYRRMSRTMVKYGIKYIQIMNVVLVLDVTWPGLVLRLRDAFASIGQYLSISGLIKFDCVGTLPNASLVKSVFQMTSFASLLIIVVAVFVLALLSTLICPRLARRLQLQMMSSAMLQIVNLLYLTLHSLALTPFACYNDGSGVFRLSSDPTIKCFTGDGNWPLMAVAGGLGFVFISVGVPVFFGVLIIIAHRHRKSTSPMARFLLTVPEFLSAPYTERFYWYEMASLLEKFLLALGALLVDLGSMAQAFYMMMVVFGFMLFYYYHKGAPFKLRLEYYWLISISLVAVLTIMVAGIAAGQSSDSGETSSRDENIGVTLMTATVYGGVFWMVTLSLYSLVHLAKEEWRQCCGTRCGRRGNDRVSDEGSTSGDDIATAKGEMPIKEANPFIPPDTKPAPIIDGLVDGKQVPSVAPPPGKVAAVADTPVPATVTKVARVVTKAPQPAPQGRRPPSSQPPPRLSGAAVKGPPTLRR